MRRPRRNGGTLADLPASDRLGQRVRFLLGWDPKIHPYVEGVVLHKYAHPMAGDEYVVAYDRGSGRETVAARAINLQVLAPARPARAVLRLVPNMSRMNGGRRAVRTNATGRRYVVGGGADMAAALRAEGLRATHQADFRGGEDEFIVRVGNKWALLVWPLYGEARAEVYDDSSQRSIGYQEWNHEGSGAPATIARWIARQLGRRTRLNGRGRARRSRR